MIHTLWLKALCALLAAAIPTAIAWLAVQRAPTWHIKSAKANEALDALSAFALHLVQTRLTADVLQGVVGMLSGGSSAAAIGSYLVGALGKPLLADLRAGASGLLGQEVGILLGGDAAVEQAALTRLGLAAAHVAGAPKMITTLADSAKLVQPA